MVVLLTTGAMNPVHLGHVSALERAAAHLESAHGYAVVGAFLSPSHDLYLRGKFSGKNDYFFPAEQRLACCAAALEGHPLIAVGRWECMQQGYWPDFPIVALALLQCLKAHFPTLQLRVFYCCGEDHYSRCGLKYGMGEIGVCVITRGGKKIALPSNTGRGEGEVIAVNVEDDTAEQSSTEIRRLLTRKSKGDEEQLRKLLHAGVLQILLRQ